MSATISFTNTEAANRLLAENPFALLVGMVLYQQVPVEKAFAAPLELQQRIGRPLSAATIVALDPEALEAIFRAKPALHRFPANMAKRTHAIAGHVVDEYGGDPEAIWSTGDAENVLKRLLSCPGFGEYKARVLLGVLVRRYSVALEGADSLLPDWPSIADVATAEDLADLKVRKRAWKDAQQA